MRTLVTGGAGFIGSHLVEAMLRVGHEVHVVDDLSTGARHNLAHLESIGASRDESTGRLRVTIDTILNESLVDRAVAEADLVFHLAAAVGVKWVIEHPLASLETNLRGTDIVLAAANRHNRPVLLASTSEVYGKNDSGPLSEDDDRILGSSRVTRWLYAITKAADESLGLAYWQDRELPVIIVRFFNTIGPRQTGRYGMVVPRFVGQALRDEPITVHGDGQQTRCFTYVGDVVKAVLSLVQCDRAWGEIFNIGRDHEISIENLARRIIELTDSRSEIQYIAYDEAYERGFEDMRRRVPNVSKLRAYVGQTPETDLDTVLRLIIRSFRQPGGPLASRAT